MFAIAAGAPSIQHNAARNHDRHSNSFLTERNCAIEKVPIEFPLKTPSVPHNEQRHKNPARAMRLSKRLQKKWIRACFFPSPQTVSLFTQRLAKVHSCSSLHACEKVAQSRKTNERHLRASLPMGLGIKHGSQEGRGGVVEVSLKWFLLSLTWQWSWLWSDRSGRVGVKGSGLSGVGNLRT